MNKTKIATGITKTFGKTGLKLKKHSPEIFIVVGIAGIIGSAVMACRATTKIGDILDKAKEDVETIKESLDDPTLADKYSQDDSQKDLTIVYAQTGLKLIKLYAPSVLLGALSITSILASNSILRKRNISLAAAYAVVDKGYKEYRSRVVERFGKDIDRELKYNIKAKQFEEVVIDENGKEKTKKTTVNVADINSYSDYARYFDESCPDWESNSSYNLMFLRGQQQFANDLLISRKYLFLNEVYTMLGIPVTKAGQMVGWVYDEKNPIGDNYVDFNIYDTNREVARNFVNGYESTILLDFNVDGNILDLI